MHRRRSAVVAALAALPLVAATAFAAPFQHIIPLADGWQPEGIATGHGFTAYVGSLADGGITKVDLRTGARDDEFVPSATGQAVGLEYEPGADRLWVAGGQSGEVRVYDATSGDLLETYSFAAGFVNDLVATNDAVYATDSFIPQVLVIPLGSDGSLPDPGDTFSLDITGAFVYGAGFNANGIVEFGGWLLVPQSGTGKLFAIDPASGDSVQLLGEHSIDAADGLLLRGSTLYVVQNQFGIISRWGIQGGIVRPLGTITDPDPGALDFPTTIAFAVGSLWAVNARFSTPPEVDTPYWITRLPAN
jgi:hypothetical protein